MQSSNLEEEMIEYLKSNGFDHPGKITRERVIFKINPDLKDSIIYSFAY